MSAKDHGGILTTTTKESPVKRKTPVTTGACTSRYYYPDPRERLWEQAQLEERPEELLDGGSLQLQAKELWQEMQEMVLDFPHLIAMMVQQEQ
ncbi:UNVERIFIED_CONTAM: hypothetical protein K2H54_061672 [Gekko kuhli]